MIFFIYAWFRKGYVKSYECNDVNIKYQMMSRSGWHDDETTISLTYNDLTLYMLNFLEEV